jgi:2-O-methyltransferase
LGIEKELGMLFKNKQALCIMDVGSCTGEDAIRYSNLFPSATVIAFEPLANNIAVMKKHFQQYGKENILIEKVALSDANGIAEFYISGGNPYNIKDDEDSTSMAPKEWNKSSSLLPPTELVSHHLPWLKFEKSEQVETITLETYMVEKNISQIDFMHIDVQGAELKVLNGMGKYIKELGAIWIEVENEELYQHQPLKSDIHSFFAKNGFQLVKDTSKNKISGDCLYVNRKKFGLMKRFWLSAIMN